MCEASGSSYARSSLMDACAVSEMNELRAATYHYLV